MNSRFMLIFAAISGLVYVALGAFGAHVLSKALGETQMAWLHTGLQYQAFHTLVILVLAVAMCQRVNVWFYWSAALLALGIVLFSGSLYCLALSYWRFWVFITPVGGLCFLAGWLLLLIGALRLKGRAESHE
ncbi:MULTISPECIES: DUF423 domain-containing protein [Dickeya]|uniref:Conserved inner membrane protein n=1 Tax=Dickeya aquatica TaxID=1401087 RepID=A0A375ADH5_9GAMM|nr:MULTISPECIES: DUF423 domain-containing protein [Dickeya]SLM64153.1 conserved inner membrane protein [Dickeya aquatica]